MADDILAEHDLLPKMIPHLDRHLVYPLLQFLAGPEDEQTPALKSMRLNLLSATNMIDYVGQLDAEVKGLSSVAPEYARKREAILKKRDELEAATARITELLDDEAVVNNLRSDKVANLNYLKENHQVGEEMVKALYEFGQFQYSCGDYAHAAELLYRFRVLSTDNDLVSSATWGKLASEILSANWDTTLEEILKARESIDTRLFAAPLAQLHHRTWLIHWSLFPFFNAESARDPLTELLFSPPYINTIQTACPWILRYLVAAVVTGRQRSRNSNAWQKQMKDLVRVVKQTHPVPGEEEGEDPLVAFIRALYVDFDFETAQTHLAAASSILSNDFFLCAVSSSFIDAARHLISESYCKIHARIDISDLSTRLGLSSDEGEKWIVNLIRDTRVDAKIDYQAGTVVMNHPPMSVYQQVIERTKGGFFRTQVLSAAVGK